MAPPGARGRDAGLSVPPGSRSSGKPRRVRRAGSRAVGGGEVIPASPLGAPGGERPAATPGLGTVGAAAPALPSPQEGAGGGTGYQELGSRCPAGPPRALGSPRLTRQPGSPLYRALGWGQERCEGREAERVLRCRELGPGRPPPPALCVGWARSGRGALGSVGRAVREDVVAAKGLNGRGWRGGPGPASLRSILWDGFARVETRGTRRASWAPAGRKRL